MERQASTSVAEHSANAYCADIGAIAEQIFNQAACGRHGRIGGDFEVLIIGSAAVPNSSWVWRNMWEYLTQICCECDDFALVGILQPFEDDGCIQPARVGKHHLLDLDITQC